MTQPYTLHEVGRIPAPGDNAAVATRRLEAGTTIAYNGAHFTTDYTILEGHRFAIEPVAAGQNVLSWGLPFGRACREIAPGAYLRNQKILDALRVRDIDFTLPPAPNFIDDPLEAYRLDERAFRPGRQVARYPDATARTFRGYDRGPRRGAGTRNYVVLLATTSQTASYVKALEERLRGRAADFPNVDGIVAVAHTEGGGATRPNNLDLLLRTLSGFMVHPNVGAVLAVDYGDEALTNQVLRRYLTEHGYPLADVPHQFMRLGAGFAADLERGAARVERWLPELAALQRTPRPLSLLKLGLQCGGSDAFSGISGNPLAAWAAKELIRCGGAANLAETDELIGAEAYVLENVRDLDTARAFLATIERFKERVSWHGHTAEGNPSGGNNYRGLYNIALKSLGAATKRDPEVRLDYTIDYAAPMTAPGYYFMDSPGNDLESIAGQVASGCNLLYFITGNGSITNFPFVPTIKIVTTTARYELLARDMDVNAGAYLDGVPMDLLGRELFARTVAAASGKRTVGERAGHAQVSIWRTWAQTDASNLARLHAAPAPRGEPLPLVPDLAQPTSRPTFTALVTEQGPATDQIGLILPTSLCAGQIAVMIADRLNQQGVGRDQFSRFVALPHTEGCGVSGGASEALYARTLLGYLLHPLVGHAVLLEHGCEKTHNDYLRQQLRERDVDAGRFGWASVQLDGGIDRVVEKVGDWFAAQSIGQGKHTYHQAGLGALRLGLAALGPVSDDTARSLATLTAWIAGAGGTVVVPETASFLASPAYQERLLASREIAPTLAYGQKIQRPGLHVMEAPSDHWVETLTGLGATGVEIVLIHTPDRPLQGHRMAPVVQVAPQPAVPKPYHDDLDLLLAGDPATWPSQLLDIILRVAGRAYTPKLFGQRNTDFQFTRGLLGVSM